MPEENPANLNTNQTPIPTKSAPPTPPTPPVENTTPTPTKKGGKTKLLAFVGAFSVLVLGVSFMFLAAYEKLPLENEALTSSAQRFVFSIPGVKPTPQYIVQRAVEAHENVAKAHIEFSLASESQSFRDILGIQNFDLKVTGPFDYSDKDNPKADMHVEFQNFDAQFKVKDKFLYFIINELPPEFSGLASGLGLDINKVLNQWVSYPLADIDSAARDMVNEESSDSFFTEEDKRMLNEIFKNEIKPYVKISSEDVDGFATHKITIEMTGEQVDAVIQALEEAEIGDKNTSDVLGTASRSNGIETIKTEINIDKKDFYVRKATMYVKYDTSSLYGSALQGDYDAPAYEQAPIAPPVIPGLASEKIEFAVALNLKNIGEDFTVDVPQDAMDAEDFFAMIAPTVPGAPNEAQKISYTLSEAARTSFRSTNTVPQSIEALFEQRGESLPFTIDDVYANNVYYLGYGEGALVFVASPILEGTIEYAVIDISAENLGVPEVESLGGKDAVVTYVTSKGIPFTADQLK